MVRRPNNLLFMPDQLRGDCAGPGNSGGARTPALGRCHTYFGVVANRVDGPA